MSFLKKLDNKIHSSIRNGMKNTKKKINDKAMKNDPDFARKKAVAAKYIEDTKKRRATTIGKGMAKKKMLEQTPTGMANKTGSDAVIPEGHAQRKCKL